VREHLLEGLTAVPKMWPCGAGVERSTEEVQAQSNGACQPSVGHSGWHPLTEPLLWQVRFQSYPSLLLLCCAVSWPLAQAVSPDTRLESGPVPGEPRCSIVLTAG